MIAKLRGVVDSTGDDWVVVDVNGVGYLVFSSARTLSRLSVGEVAVLIVETHVREDHIHLYGFSSESERSFFRLLLTVQGVGAKVALAILSVGSAEGVSRAIASADRAMLTRASGVGPKLAGRIAAELKDKVVALLGLSSGSGGAGMPIVARIPSLSVEAGVDVAGDAVSALVNLGYGRADAFSAVATSVRDLGEEATVQGLLSAALRHLGRGLQG